MVQVLAVAAKVPPMVATVPMVAMAVDLSPLILQVLLPWSEQSLPWDPQEETEEVVAMAGALQNAVAMVAVAVMKKHSLLEQVVAQVVVAVLAVEFLLQPMDLQLLLEHCAPREAVVVLAERMEPAPPHVITLRYSVLALVVRQLPVLPATKAVVDLAVE